MKIRKFVAADMKDALAQVKRDLGPDAMIVATRPVRRGLLSNGIEVTAAVDIDDTTPMPSKPAAPAAVHLSDTDIDSIVAPLRSELRSLRTQLRQVEARDDHAIKNELKELRKAIALMGQKEAANDSEPTPALSSVAANHRLTAPSKARVIGLVGPTGVGKTTTIAKLAAQAALVERRSVAIVTLDSFRVGGEEQMRTFADLIGVPMIAAAPDRLAEVLESLHKHDRIYVDTAGRSPRDTAAVHDLARAFAGLDVEIHLTLPAGSSRTAIDACAARMSEIPIARLLFTKIDEAERLDEIVRAPARLNHAVSFITTGQRVPEDIEEATPERLLELATFGFFPHGEAERAA